MKNRFIPLLILLSFSSTSMAITVYCELESKYKFDSKQFVFSDGDSINTLIYPKVESAKLRHVQLRYGYPNNPIKNEIFTYLDFSEFDNRYEVKINLSNDHQPLSIRAIYHHNVCVSIISIIIVEASIQVME